MRRSRLRLSPSVGISVLALFFALGGSAFAFERAAKPAKCPVGSARAIAVVTGDPTQGIENLPDAYSADAKLFAYRWSCSGAPTTIQVRKSTRDIGVSGYRGFDIRFPGNPGKVVVATVSADTPVAASSFGVGDGSFHVSTGGDVQHSGFVARSASVVVVLF